MPDVDLPTWLAAIILGGVAATSLLGIARFVARVMKRVEKIGMWFWDKGKVAMAEVVDDRLNAILGEVTHNGGTSLKDHTVQTRRMLEDHIEDPDAHTEPDA